MRATWYWFLLRSFLRHALHKNILWALTSCPALVLLLVDSFGPGLSSALGDLIQLRNSIHIFALGVTLRKKLCIPLSWIEIYQKYKKVMLKKIDVQDHIDSS